MTQEQASGPGPTIVKPTMIFHIGLHKTATKWLQRRLFPRLEGVELIEVESVRTASELAACSAASTVIVSHESMSGMINEGRRPGTSSNRLRQSLAGIARLHPHAGIVVGFREHGSWINSAYAQRAKKRNVTPQQYLMSFSAEDLSWCGKLDGVEASCRSVFPFLYEELAHDPRGLIVDLCRFIGVATPAGLEELLEVRENPSPRGRAGQLLAQPFYRSSRTLGRLPGVDPEAIRDFGGRLGARLDRIFPAGRAITFDKALHRELHQDWINLLRRIETLRGRDFTAWAL